MAILKISVLLFSCLCAANSMAHSGGLDVKGGHYNSKTGQYHYHRQSRALSASSVTQYSLPKSTREARIRSYFKAANSGVTRNSLETIKRDVSGSQRRRVLARDGNRCVVCGSTAQLEVDHRQALMNGGDNSLDNLATLCDDCHTIKTRIDYRLNERLRP